MKYGAPRKLVQLIAIAGGICAFESQAIMPTHSPPNNTECLGYFIALVSGSISYPYDKTNLSTVNLQDDIWHQKENSSQFDFPPIGAWGNVVSFSYGAGGDEGEQNRIYASEETKKQTFEETFNEINKQRKRYRSSILEFLEQWKPRGRGSATEEKAEAFLPAKWQQTGKSFYILESSRPDIIPPSDGDEFVNFRILLGGRSVSSIRKMEGSPQETIDKFLAHYRERKTFEVPPGPGACTPYGFITGETKPAMIATSMISSERPEIVIFFSAEDSSSLEPLDPKEQLNRLIGWHFYAAHWVEPLDKWMKPIRKMAIDGQEGVGAFSSILRENKDQSSYPPVDNTENNGRDFGYMAYVPGKRGGKPGEEFDLVLRVERFGRFAKQPMSEKEFREFVATLIAGIHRRPGAWVPH